MRKKLFCLLLALLMCVTLTLVFAMGEGTAPREMLIVRPAFTLDEDHASDVLQGQDVDSDSDPALTPETDPKPDQLQNNDTEHNLDPGTDADPETDTPSNSELGAESGFDCEPETAQENIAESAQEPEQDWNIEPGTTDEGGPDSASDVETGLEQESESEQEQESESEREQESGLDRERNAGPESESASVSESEFESEIDSDHDADAESEEDADSDAFADADVEADPNDKPEPGEDKEQPEPTFVFHTPENLNISFGVEYQSIGSVWLSDIANLREGDRVLLTISEAAFVNRDDPSKIIPVSITDAYGNHAVCLGGYGILAQPVELYIRVSADAWRQAASGTYVASVAYDAFVESVY